MACTLSALHVFPLKSGAALSPDQVEVTPLGLRHDRHWMLVDADGRFISGRQQAKLLRLQVRPTTDALQLGIEGRWHAVQQPAHVERIQVSVWKDSISAAHWPGADPALSDWLGQPVRLVHRDENATRAVDADYAQAGDQVSFADGFPILLLSTAAVDSLNERLAEPVTALHFRPNLLIDGSAPHAEDQWKRIRIGEIEFDVVKPCTRCVLTTVDPMTGARRGNGEPLQTLKDYRRSAKGITFGQNLIPRGSGLLRIGDPVSVLQ